MMSTRELYAELTRKIQGVRRLERSVLLQTALVNTITVTLATWTLAIALEALVGFQVPARGVLFHSAIGVNAVLALWLLLPPLARMAGVVKSEDDDSLAGRIGRGIPAVGDRLLNTLQLFRTSGSPALALGYSAELVDASILAQGEPVRHHDYTAIVNREHRRRAVFLLLSSVIAAGALMLVFPGAFRAAAERLADYNRVYTAPAPFTLSIAPGNRRLVRGDSADIIIRAVGIAPRTVRLRMAVGSAAADEVELRADSSGVFRYHLPSVTERVVYSAHAGPIASSEHSFDVIDRPEIRLLRVAVAHPSYTGRGTERLPDNVGDVRGLRGTAVNVELTANIEPAAATIVQLFPRGRAGVPVATARPVALTASPEAVRIQYDTVRIRMAVEGTSVRGGFRLVRDGEYYIELRSAEGLVNLAPVHYRMTVGVDAPPAITLLQPGDSVDVDRTMLLPVQVHISDDYGFSRLRVMYRLAFSRYAPPAEKFAERGIPIPRGGGLSIDVPYIWDMTGMSMVPEDVVELYVEVYDNDVVGGPKVARTDTVRVRFPSLDEVLQKTEQIQTQATAELNKMLKQAQESAKEMEGLNRELMKQMAQNQQEANWQNKQKVQELLKQQEAMRERMEKVAEDLRTVAEKLKEAQAISPETLQKYTELQKLFEQLKNPALLEQMRKMQQQMERMTPEQLAEAMKNYRFNDEQFRKSIERTMNILKRMQVEQKVDEMIRRADELERQQENINKAAEAVDPNDQAMRQQLAERQQQLAENARKLEKEMAELTQQAAEMGGDMPQKELEQAEQMLGQDGPRQGMEKASEQMQQGQMRNAQQQGQQAQQAARDFKEKMQAVKKQMQENGRREVLNKMKKSLKDLLELSKRQEELKRQTDDAQPNSQQFRDLAEQQQQLGEQMENLANQMMSLGQKSFAVTPEMGRELGNAMQQMSDATGSLEKRDGAGASQQEGGAMGSMNNAAKMMSQAIGQMQNEGNGQGAGMGMGMGSMQQRLQQMAAQQQMINQAMGQQQGQGQQGQQQGQGGQQGQGKEGEGEGSEGENGRQKNGAGKKNGRDGQGGDGGNQEQGGQNGQGSGRLARQQEEVKKSLDELNKEAREQGGTRKNMLGDLERAAKEIDEVLSDMKSGQISPETIQRQQRILSRLLDAARSQRERDFEQKRESKPGQDVVREGPGSLKLDDADAAERMRRDLLNTREQGYTKDYEYMIQKYFEQIGRGSGAPVLR